MQKLLILSLAATSGLAAIASSHSNTPASLKEVYAPFFTVGAAVKETHFKGREADLLLSQYNSITPENLLKWEKVHPTENAFFWDHADAMVEFGTRNGLEIFGHTLIWHNQTPDWVFKDVEGNDASPELLLERMRNHIHTVVGRYKGRVHGWDVVNEALNEDGSMRESGFYRILGEDYIAKAFIFAHEADPAAQLIYNDFNIENPEKRAGTVRLIRKLLDQGIPISGVGIQEHVRLDWPSRELLSEAIAEYAALGIKVMITELDVDVLPSAFDNQGADLSLHAELRDELNPYANGLPGDVQQALAKRYGELFSVYLEHADAIARVTLWGLHDGGSWLNHWPMRGRTSYPLLHDRNMEPKPAFFKILEVGATAKSCH